MPILTCKRVVYFSQGDEKAFFDWLNNIKAVRKWHGVYDTLFLHVQRRISDVGYRELKALFERYRIDRKQLAKLAPPSKTL